MKKWIKLIATVLVLTLLSGCSQTVTQKHIQEAEAACTSKEGVYQIYINTDVAVAYCKDGSRKRLNR